MAEKKKEDIRCFTCKHLKALPLNHPCKKCHSHNRWARMTQQQFNKRVKEIATTST